MALVRDRSVGRSLKEKARATSFKISHYITEREGRNFQTGLGIDHKRM